MAACGQMPVAAIRNREKKHNPVRSSRLKEELGFETELEKVFDFIYKAEFDNGLAEYEFDHVFTGRV